MENHTKERLQDPTMQVPSLNCIDLADHDLHRSVVSLKQACLDSGFFYVINHGINEEFMEDVFEQSKKFFALPLEEKMKVLRNEKHRGYTPVLDEILDPENQVNGDHKEGYYIGIEVPKDDPDYDKPFYGPNPWPDSDVLPQWRETMEKYHQEALRVSKDIGRLLALALDLDANYFDTPEMLGKPIATMRLLHYQGVSDPSQGIYACGAHSDYGMMTLLATDGVMGLQICKDKNAKPQKWEYVPAIKGAYIVNLGDMLERWSNGFFKSTLHRVLGNGQERYSIPFFVEPNHECLVECLPTCKSESNVPKYPAIKCSAYLTQRYKETHAELSIYNQEI
ncbi:2-oxoglutarate (2OG) and Fe(II)-dependent oxygenase superfamily protein [Raphanus sativus]|uniref:2-oxoglutarate-Fe(II) type oxidoreductase hxnY n=1 Tax=Raphanus sativus TaxID=3726 RepID=A0A6J0NNB5_RAPSA|nr:2-oxoglutarate-Fe(II) type oxidoreductase hxnY [Raphanus sativus]KAJ4895064.1 2-oxoglutarate (2OG) and Fe(II)-dependent oxygenase superfamily protein [Raphanus sativus]